MKNKMKKLLSTVLALFMALTIISPLQTQASVNKGKSGSITYEAHDTGNGVILILKNGSKNILDVNVKVVYYNSGKKMVGTASDSNYAFHGKMQCAMFFNAPHDSDYQDVKYSSFKVNINAEKAERTISRASKISVSSDEGEENVTAKVKNKSKDKLNSIQVAIVWYEGNEAIGYDYAYAECNKKGSTDYVTFNFPYDSDFETIYPDSYKIFVNNAYTYTWMK